MVGHLRYSLFAPAMARLVRESHLSVGMAMLLVHLASLLDDVVCGMAAGGAML